MGSFGDLGKTLGIGIAGLYIVKTISKGIKQVGKAGNTGQRNRIKYDKKMFMRKR